MKVNVLKHEGNELRIELVGEGHSFCNALESTLIKDDTLDSVGYNIPHPLVGSPIFYVRAKGRREPLKGSSRVRPFPPLSSIGSTRSFAGTGPSRN